MRVIACTLFALLFTTLAVSESSAQNDTRRVLVQRFGVRGTTAAAFLESYTSFILGRERTLATKRLASPTVTDAQFHGFLDVFDFGSAVLLDGSGRDLDVAPHRSDLIGQDLAARYDHLALAVQGQASVSNVVSSAGADKPTVAFATPFDTPYGQRVISGAFDIASHPLGLYLRHVLPYTTGAVYLVDSAGRVIASNESGQGPESTPPAHALAAHSDRDGTTRDRHGRALVFATATVQETPWRLVVTVPAATLYSPISSGSRVLPWVFLGAFALAGAGLLILFVRYREGRAAAHVDARTDALTGLPNRRAIDETIDRLLADHLRYGSGLGVLIVDIDRFKAINDAHGHGVGDVVLRQVAARAANCVRINDVCGRWGGEEFVVLAPHTDHDGLAAIAERVRNAVRGQVVTVGDAVVPVTVSVGGAIARPGDDRPADLVARADAALYTAKNTGRDRTIVADATQPAGLVRA